jgi:ribosomal protein S18 acetylase RimI-like enzyme
MTLLQQFENSIDSLPPGVLVEACREDLEEIVDLHLLAFPDTFMTPLGRSFVRIYFQAALSFPGAIFVIYKRNSAIVGLVLGVRSPRQFQRHLLFRYGLQAIAASVHCPPRALLNILRRFAQKINPRRGSSGHNFHADAECLAMAVHPACQDPSIAAFLTAAFLTRMGAEGVNTVLSGIRADNLRLLRFARMFGYREICLESRPDGHQMQILMWSKDH